MQAFRKLYEAVGLGWVYAITKYEPVSPSLTSSNDVLLFAVSFHNWNLFSFIESTDDNV